MEISSRRVISNTLVQFLVRSLVVFISLFTTRYLTHRLGVTGYADFGFFTASVTLFYALGDWGTQLMMIREGAQAKRLETFWWNAFWLRLGLVTIGYAAYLVFLFFGDRAGISRETFAWGGLILFLFSIKTTAQAVFQIRLRHDLSAFLELLAAIIFFLLLIFFRPLVFPEVISQLLLAAGLTALVGLGALLLFSPPEGRIDLARLRELFRKSGMMGLVMVVYSLLGRVSIFFLKKYAGEDSLGYYVLAQKVYDNAILGAAYLMNVLYPLVAYLDQERDDRERLGKLLRVGYTTLGIMALAVFAVGSVFAKPLVLFLGGSDFGPAQYFLRGLLIILFVGYLNHLSGYALIGLGKQKSQFYIGMAGLVTSVAAHFYFFKLWGPIGVVAAAAVAELVIFIISYRQLRRLGYKITFRFYEAWGYLVKGIRKSS